MNTFAYFEKINEKIALLLEDANHTIHVAMAWFTNEQLFKILCKKAEEGLIVKILLLQDEINTTSKIWHDELLLSGGLLSFVGSREDMMHHKFCVIDNKTVITGSYNWTYGAQHNDENIVVIKNNFAFANTFVSEYYRLYRKFVEKTSYQAIQKEVTCVPLKEPEILSVALKIAKTHEVPVVNIEEALGIAKPNK